MNSLAESEKKFAQHAGQRRETSENIYAKAEDFKVCCRTSFDFLPTRKPSVVSAKGIDGIMTLRR
jgi:hypothetical protein